MSVGPAWAFLRLRCRRIVLLGRYTADVTKVLVEAMIAGQLVCGAAAAAVSQPGAPLSGPYFAPVLLKTSDFGAAQGPAQARIA